MQRSRRHSRIVFRMALSFLVVVSFSAVPRTYARGLDQAAASFRVYVGTYTSDKSENPSRGIYVMELDPAGGNLSAPRLAAVSIDPSFLAIHPSGRFLYAVNEVNQFQGRTCGGVSGFAIDPAHGRLKPINQQSSRGESPCHLTVDRAGKNVLVANYSSGSVACLPIEPDGRLKPASSAIQHQGSSADPNRQQGPHAHSINIDPGGRFAVAADLGLDKVFIYAFDPDAGTLKPSAPDFTKLPPASGPRHFAFSPSGRFGYVINELADTIVAFAHDPETGSLAPIQSISTLPAGFKGKSFTAHVEVHPSGKFLYGSNRGHDSIAIYSIDQATGKLTLVAIEPTLGKEPRNFAIDPTGAILLAENQNSGSIVVFRIDPETGRLTPTGQKVAVPKPVCVKMIELPRETAR